MESARILIRTRAPRAVMRAFTLIEMLVVLAIISVVTTITLVGHSDFDRSLLLTDAAYSVALSAREMQTFGLSSRAFSTYTNIGYGIHVRSSAPASYLAFADIERVSSVSQTICPSGTVSTDPEYKRGNCIYESASPADGLVESFAFGRGFRITRFCGKVGATQYCSNDASPLTMMDVVFMRPNTDAVVTGRRATGSPIDLDSAQIYISTADGAATRGICITQIGQISVSTGACP